MLSNFRDRLGSRKTLDQVYTFLTLIGVNSKIAESERPEESFALGWGGEPKGLIDLYGEPIKWIRVRMVGGRSSLQYVEYGVEDTNQIRERVHISVTKSRNIPILGKVIDLKWKGQVLGDLHEKPVDIISEGQQGGALLYRLNNDGELKVRLIRGGYSLTLRSYPDRGVWIMSSFWTGTGLSKDEWDSYKVIAMHVQAKW